MTAQVHSGGREFAGQVPREKTLSVGYTGEQAFHWPDEANSRKASQRKRHDAPQEPPGATTMDVGCQAGVMKRSESAAVPVSSRLPPDDPLPLLSRLSRIPACMHRLHSAAPFTGLEGTRIQYLIMGSEKQDFCLLPA